MSKKQTAAAAAPAATEQPEATESTPSELIGNNLSDIKQIIEGINEQIEELQNQKNDLLKELTQFINDNSDLLVAKQKTTNQASDDYEKPGKSFNWTNFFEEFRAKSINKKYDKMNNKGEFTLPILRKEMASYKFKPSTIQANFKKEVEKKMMFEKINSAGKTIKYKCLPIPSK